MTQLTYKYEFSYLESIIKCDIYVFWGVLISICILYFSILKIIFCPLFMKGKKIRTVNRPLNVLFKRNQHLTSPYIYEEGGLSVGFFPHYL